MNIYIDESGNFTNSPTKDFGISCVGALIVPSNKLQKLEQDFIELSINWPRENNEIKGKLLNEEHFIKLCHLLKRLGCILEITAIDLNMHNQADIKLHQTQQAALLTHGLTDEFEPSFVNDALKYRQMLENLPAQLYVQAVTTTELIVNLLQLSTLYYSQRKPFELSQFNWFVDRKDKSIVTNYEEYWQGMIPAMLQSISIIKQPILMLPGGNYKYFKKNFVPFQGMFHLKKEECIDIKSIMHKNFQLADSKSIIELQIVYMLVNAFRRMLSNNFSPLMIAELGSIMIKRKNQIFISLGNAINTKNTSYLDTTKSLLKYGRSILK